MNKWWLMVGAASASAMMPAIAVAADYMTAESALREFFPLADQFDDVALALTSEQRQTIASLAGAQPPHGKLRVWKARLGGRELGYAFVDEVVGRQDMITYAVAIDIDGKLSAIEILSYRESHGGEIRNSAWRKQFAGQDSLTQLRFRTDIKNIAGATLSSEHVTQGVRWLLSLWQTALKSPTTSR